jgi:hypothetical protein
MRRRGFAFLPPDQLVEDLDELLYLVGLGGGLDLKEGEGRRGSLCVEVHATGLDKAADEEDVEECIRIFEEFQGRSGLDELVGNRVVVALGNSFEVLVHLISEYYKKKTMDRGDGDERSYLGH